MKCNDCDKEAIAEVEMGFRSIRVKIPKCEKHLKEWNEKMTTFRKINDTLTK